MGLIGHWPLVSDGDNSLGQYLCGTGSYVFSSGKVGGALNPGSGGYVDCGMLPESADLTGDMSISFLVNLTAYPSSRCGILETSYGAEVALNVTSSGSMQWYWGTAGRNTTGYQAYNTPSGVLPIGTETHITLTRDGTTGEVVLYKDGVAIHSTIRGTDYLPTARADDGYPLKLGRSYTGILTGTLANVKIWDHCLSAKEAREESKLKVLHYPFSEPDSVVQDVSGFRNHGTLGADAPEWVEDAAVGCGSYFFNDNVISTNILVPDSMTCTIWFVSSVIGGDNFHIPLSVSGSSVEISVTASGEIRTGVVVNGSRKVTNSGGGLLDGRPHLLTLRHDGADLTAFIDGEETTTVSAAGTKELSGVLRIGRFQEEANKYCSIQAAHTDVRIYATALSNEDIKELYQTRAELDSSGNHYAHGYSELGPEWDIEYEGNNLVLNGNGELENTTNVPNCVYTTEDAVQGAGCFKVTGSKNIQLSEFIPIDPDDEYELSGHLRSVGAGGLSRVYFGFAPYDKNKKFIDHRLTHHYSASRTTLAQPIYNGDTVIHLSSTDGWRAEYPGTYQHYKVFTWWGPDWEYPAYTYAQGYKNYLDVDAAANTLTLQYAWDRGYVPAGTPVANGYNGDNYMYSAASYARVPTTWTRYTATRTGWTVNSDSGFRYGTAFVRILFLANYTQSSEYSMLIDRLFLANRSSAQLRTSGALSRQGVLVGGVDEITREGSSFTGISSMRVAGYLHNTASAGWYNWAAANAREFINLETLPSVEVLRGVDLVVYDSAVWAVPSSHMDILKSYVDGGISCISVGNDTTTNVFVASKSGSTKGTHTLRFADHSPFLSGQTFSGSTDAIGGIDSLQGGALAVSFREDSGQIMGYVYRAPGGAVLYHDQECWSISTGAREELVIWAGSKSDTYSGNTITLPTQTRMALSRRSIWQVSGLLNEGK